MNSSVRVASRYLDRQAALKPDPKVLRDGWQSLKEGSKCPWCYSTDVSWDFPEVGEIMVTCRNCRGNMEQRVKHDSWIDMTAPDPDGPMMTPARREQIDPESPLGKVLRG